jgi:hypothetical protein
VLVVVLVIVTLAHDLTTSVRAADRAHTVRPARAVARRALVDGGRADLVLGAPLSRTGM